MKLVYRTQKTRHGEHVEMFYKGGLYILMCAPWANWEEVCLSWSSQINWLTPRELITMAMKCESVYYDELDRELHDFILTYFPDDLITMVMLESL